MHKYGSGKEDAYSKFLIKCALSFSIKSLVKDRIYAMYLSLSGKGYPKISEETFQMIKEVHDTVYPEEFGSYGDFSDVNGLYKFYNAKRSQMSSIIVDNYYILFVKRFYGVDFIDMAGQSDNPLVFLRLIKRGIKQFTNTYATAVSRDNTSYRLLLHLEKKGLIKILRTVSSTWRGEPFHVVALRVL